LNLFSVLNAYQRRIRPTPEPGQTRWSLKHGAISVVPRVAYINHGRWVADCVRPYCGGAEALRPHQVVVECFECHLVAPVEWPREAQELWEALMVRPVPATRNWFPAGHRPAVRAGCPHGQTVDDLHAETAEHAHELMPGGAAAHLEGGAATWRGQLH
jgi:hypothetical protein